VKGERPNWFERMISALAPQWGLSRARARLATRHYEAASVGRRTSGWSRLSTDANAAAPGATLAHLRAQARDLVRNNPWARRGIRRLVTNTVGWGIRPKATGKGAEAAMRAWARWGETTECDAGGRHTFYGLQRQVMRTVVESGEVIVRRRMRRPDPARPNALPIQLQILEPDYIDTGKDAQKGEGGGPIVQGVEYDTIGRRVAYWLFDEHPGGRHANPLSRRVPADGVVHVFDQERPGQVRGPSWFAAVDVRLHDFDEFEDATLMKQKIAACMAAFVTDLDGSGSPLGEGSTDAATSQPIDTFEPGMILNLPAGKQVTVANPPASTDHQSFSSTALRGVAAGRGVTDEDHCGDYSQVNFSSARLARIAHLADIDDWRWNMLIPQFCAPVWSWMIGALNLLGEDVEDAPAQWTPPPLRMIDPNTEGQALMRMVRTGALTVDEMVREQGFDPEAFWQEYAESLKRLDALGIVLDCDPRRTTGAGQLQAAPAAPAAPPKNGKPAVPPPAAAEEGN
jgi:lambda family phage portal protein